MTKVVTNSAISALRGGMGDIVYKTYKRGKYKVVVASRRARMEGVIWSEDQKGNRNRMRDAGKFYREVAADPAGLARYREVAEKKGITVPALTLKDFFRAPQIGNFELRNYSGRPGDILTVLVTDPLEAHQATFTVRTLDGEVRERGPGQMAPHQNCQFFYVATSVVAASETVLIEVVVSDRPGNIVVGSVKWTQAADTPAPIVGASVAPPPVPALSYGAEDTRAG